MKTLSGLLLTAALFGIAGAASAGDKIDVMVVTAKKPAATMLTDVTDRIVTATGDALRSNQSALAGPAIQIEIPALAPNHG